MADEIKRAAASVARMVDEYTDRGWNDEGRDNFALIVEKRLRRFIKNPQPARSKQATATED